MFFQLRVEDPPSCRRSPAQSSSQSALQPPLHFSRPWQLLLSPCHFHAGYPHPLCTSRDGSSGHGTKKIKHWQQKPRTDSRSRELKMHSLDFTRTTTTVGKTTKIRRKDSRWNFPSDIVFHPIVAAQDQVKPRKSRLIGPEWTSSNACHCLLFSCFTD